MLSCMMMIAEKEVIAMLEMLEYFEEYFEEYLEKKHPLCSMIVFQIAVGAGLVAAVGGIAFAGAGILWMFCNLAGVM